MLASGTELKQKQLLALLGSVWYLTWLGGIGPLQFTELYMPDIPTNIYNEKTVIRKPVTGFFCLFFHDSLYVRV